MVAGGWRVAVPVVVQHNHTSQHKEGKWGLAGRRRRRGHLVSESRLLAATKLVVVECRLCSLEVDSQEGRSGWVRVKGGLVVGAGLGLGDR